MIDFVFSQQTPSGKQLNIKIGISRFFERLILFIIPNLYAFDLLNRPFPSPFMSADQSKPPMNTTTPLVREDVPGVLTTKGSYQPGRKLQPDHGDVQLPKRTRSPTIPSPNGNFAQNPASGFDIHKRYERNLNIQHLLVHQLSNLLNQKARGINVCPGIK